ncbi:hypothetical protein F4780DRAFT_771470 [Xylariomycetidae sp. FL0641]|nr:hypothetical protein F4780DRAFT_771470 [Xylariomycetidae sp. FL0641]
MEQSVAAHTPATVPPKRSRPAPVTTESASHLTHSEPSPDDLSDSVPSLRFPRPLGNRQLTNWVSSSSPDIMQPNTFPDEDPTLTELGYDIIGTDGESQAESIASSSDYQRPDDVQSLAGTDTGTDVDTNDADTDSDNDDDDALSTKAVASFTLEPECETSLHGPTDLDDNDAAVETLADQSLENPTGVSQQGVMPYDTMAEQLQAQALLNAMLGFASSPEGPFADKNMTPGRSSPSESTSPPSDKAKRSRLSEIRDLALRYMLARAHVLALVSGILIFYGLAVSGKWILFNSQGTRELVTVPVASVNSAFTGSSATTPVLSTFGVVSTSTSVDVPTALQTSSSSNALVFSPFGKDKVETGLVPSHQQNICSAEAHGRNAIMVKIPKPIKASWLAKEAIMVAVSRGLQDIQTKMSSVDEGFLIEIPSEEAHGALAVSIATTRKPKINETFRINFGNHMLIEAFDAGRQLVRGLAQRVVDTVNETSVWVEETYIPAFDVISKQVCHQTASYSDSLLQSFRDAGNAALTLPAHITSELASHVGQTLDRETIAQRADQAQLVLTRQLEDVRNELSLTLLKSQIGSKLLWLKMRGKVEEYQHYQSKAEAYWKEKRADVARATLRRAEEVKKQIQARRKPVGAASRGSFWKKGSSGA